MERRYQTYEEFWPFYVAQHRARSTRWLHFAGTTLVLASVAAAILVSPRWLLAAPLGGYGLAWLGHFACERNRPATFEYPLWSLRADFRMYGLMWRGRMGPELERARAQFPAGT